MDCQHIMRSGPRHGKKCAGCRVDHEGLYIPFCFKHKDMHHRDWIVDVEDQLQKRRERNEVQRIEKQEALRRAPEPNAQTVWRKTRGGHHPVPEEMWVSETRHPDASLDHFVSNLLATFVIDTHRYPGVIDALTRRSLYPFECQGWSMEEIADNLRPRMYTVTIDSKYPDKPVLHFSTKYAFENL